MRMSVDPAQRKYVTPRSFHDEPGTDSDRAGSRTPRPIAWTDVGGVKSVLSGDQTMETANIARVAQERVVTCQVKCIQIEYIL